MLQAFVSLGKTKGRLNDEWQGTGWYLITLRLWNSSYLLSRRGYLADKERSKKNAIQTWDLGAWERQSKTFRIRGTSEGRRKQKEVV